MKETEEGFHPIPEPTGAFLLRNGEGKQMQDGRYYHYSEVCKLLKLYHSERLAQSLPTEEEIKVIIKEQFNADADPNQKFFFGAGLRKCIELLTKGEK